MKKNQDDTKEILYTQSSNKKTSITVWLDEETRAKWDLLRSRKVRVAEHARLVLLPEIDRLLSIDQEKQKEITAS